MPIEATHPGLRPFVLKTHREAAEQQIASARVAVDVATKKLAESEATAKELAAKTKRSKPETPTDNASKPAVDQPTDSSIEALVRDDFSVAKPDLWEHRTGKWNYTDGKLTQSRKRARPAPACD